MAIAKAEVQFRSPSPQANGLQAAPDGLWLCDQVDNKIDPMADNCRRDAYHLRQQAIPGILAMTSKPPNPRVNRPLRRLC